MKTIFTVSILLAGLFCASFAQQPDHTNQARNFISLLDKKLRDKIQYPYDDAERFNWHFVPRSRNGISFNDMNVQQKEAAMALLRASLSEQGYLKASGILALEAILREVEGRDTDDSYRDPGKYYFTFFGTPGADKPWGWRVEGHHISLNFSSLNGLIGSSTPSFMGSNPAVVPRGGEKGKQVLKDETDLGFSLVNSLEKEQLKVALFSETALPEIITGNNRKAENLEPKGISYAALNDDQRKLFLQLLDVYVKNYQFGFSVKLMEKIKKAGIENLSFAWAGSLTPGAGHYYRIQGPMLLIEYDNTQNNANHVHTVVRDLTNDFAEDILKEHYAKEH
ncbi:MAG: DUF3500 domain-containing protein [Bacteroidota bacterium]